MEPPSTQLSRSGHVLPPVSYHAARPGEPWKPGQFRAIVRIPAGRCPITFEGMWELPCMPPTQILCGWFWMVRELGLMEERQIYYTAEAIAYWAKDLMRDWDVDGEEVDDIIYTYARLIGDWLAPVQD